MKDSNWCLVLVVIVIATACLFVTDHGSQCALCVLACVLFGLSRVCSAIENIFKKPLNFTINGNNQNENDTNQ